MRIALVGRMGRGKSTVSTHLVCEHGFVRIGFADKLKEIVKDLRPDLFEKGNKPRMQLQRVGEVLKNELGTGIWLDYVLEQIDNDIENNTLPRNFVIDDVRFVFEAEALRKAGFTIIKIDGPNQRNDNGDEVFGGHSSEQEVDKIEYDVLLVNNSTLEQLHKTVDILVNNLKQKSEWANAKTR